MTMIVVKSIHIQINGEVMNLSTDRSINLTMKLNNNLTTNIAMCPIVSNYLVVKFLLYSFVMVNTL